MMEDNIENLHKSECQKIMRDDGLEDDAEDFIQPSQPLSFQNHSPEKVAIQDEMGQMNISTIDETLPFPKSTLSTPICDTSHDFIPESENPVKRKLDMLETEEVCRKRLNLDQRSMIKETPDMFSSQSQVDDSADCDRLRFDVQGKFDLENLSLVPESPLRINETVESVESDHSYMMFTESKKRVFLNETRDEDSLSQTLPSPFCVKRECSEKGITETIPSEMVRMDSGKLTHDSGMPSLLRTDAIPSQVEDIRKTLDSQETQLDDTVDAEDIELYNSYGMENNEDAEKINEKMCLPLKESLNSSPERHTDFARSVQTEANQKISGLKTGLKNISDEESARLQKHSTPENPLSKSPKINESASSIENGTPPVQDEIIKSTEINFTIYLQLDCQLMMDPILGEPVSKKIVNVKELLKRQPKHIFSEPNSDSSYKTKTPSSSSSGSVYSDKTGLPYALPARSLLPASGNSSSSSVDLAKHMKIVGRQVWINEYKLPMALDEVIPRYVKNHKLSMQPKDCKTGGKRKMSIREKNTSNYEKNTSNWNQPLDSVLEGDATEQSSGNNTDVLSSDLNKSATSEPPENVAEKKNLKGVKNAEKLGNSEKIIGEFENDLNKKTISRSPGENEFSRGIISEGLLVFARWTDKRYYPGIVGSKAKYDRWEVKFDDNTDKLIREDLILPLNWLTKGELVFALAADKYMSGKIADIIRNEEIQFKIELDDTNEEIVVKKSDICLNDVMAGIIREKLRPSDKIIPPLKSCDIDVENVVTGKRVREQRTPVRTPLVPAENSTTKRKGAVNSVERKGMETPSKKRSSSLVNPEVFSERKTRGSSRKKEENPECIGSTTEETPVKLDSKSDARKKRARTLKFVSNGSKSSNLNLIKSNISNKQKIQVAQDQKSSDAYSKSVLRKQVDGGSRSILNRNADVKKKGPLENENNSKKSGLVNKKGDGDKVSTRPKRKLIK